METDSIRVTDSDNDSTSLGPVKQFIKDTSQSCFSP